MRVLVEALHIADYAQEAAGNLLWRLWHREQGEAVSVLGALR